MNGALFFITYLAHDIRYAQYRGMRKVHLILVLCVFTGFLGCDSEQTAETEATISVDNANFTGSCPHDYQISGIISVDLAPTTIRYIWERSTGNSETLSVTLPSAGGVIVTDVLRITSSGTATVRLHLISPEDKLSNEITVTTTCQ